jgi:putative NADH-flavin reductase
MNGNPQELYPATTRTTTETSMHIALYGATGRTGSRILTEALHRGHTVKAIVRDPAAFPATPGVTVVPSDLSVPAIAAAIQGTDAVVSALAPPADNPNQLADDTQLLIDAITLNGGPRLLVVGGAGTLFVAPGVTLIDSGYLPAEWLPLAIAHKLTLDRLRASSIDWTSFSPAAYFDPGERTGTFRLGTDDLISDANQQSRISMEDYAIALIDELEHPHHIRSRFTIGY